MTGNTRAVRSSLGLGVVPLYPFPNAKSTTISGGDFVVLTTASADTTASNPVVRTVIQDDIDDLFESPIAGILGVAGNDAVTNSSGVASSQVVYSGKSPSAEPTLSLPSYGLGQPPDPNIGYTEMMVAVAYPDVVYRGTLKSGQTASNLILGLAGLYLSAGLFYIDTTATTKVFSIIGWDPSNTGVVYFTILPAYCQILTGVFYGD